MTKVYYATLDRFGYDMEVIETSKQKAIDAIMHEYAKAYVQRNCGVGEFYEEDRLNAKADIEIQEMEIGRVEWR